MSEQTSLAGGSNGRKVKDALATYHEDAGFPASMARYQVLQAITLIQNHVRLAGPAAPLERAIESLDAAIAHIEAWRAADQKRCNYPYIRQPKGHA